MSSQLLTITFDQFVRSGSISAGNFVGHIAPAMRRLNVVHAHGGGSVIGPMAVTSDSGLGASPTVDFLDVPGSEIEGSTGLLAVQELGFPLTVI